MTCERLLARAAKNKYMNKFILLSQSRAFRSFVSCAGWLESLLVALIGESK